jgi:hypothetical protein
MKYIFTFFVCAILVSCASSSIHTGKTYPPAIPYHRIVTFFVGRQLNLNDFDSLFYEEYLLGQFNNLDDLPVRRQMQRTLKRNLGSAYTEIIASSDLFDLNDKVPFDSFRTVLDRIDPDAVFIVNMENYRETPAYTKVGSTYQYSGEPSAAYNSYLVDFHTGKIAWMSHAVVRGIWAGYDVLNNTVARRISTNLRIARYIL